MKRILIAFAAFLLTGASTFGQALIQGGLLPPTPGQANAVTFALKPLSHYNETFSSVGFTIQIPVSVGPKPSIINLESYLPTVFPLAAWGIEEITHEGFYNYLLYCVTNNPPSTVIPANTEQPILKIAFDVNPFTAATTRVRVAHLAGAGPETKYQFFVTSNGLDNLNYKQMFFGAVRAPTIPYDDDQVGWDNYQYAETTFDVALPVKFLNFLALKNGDDARLSWTVEQDQDNKQFEIERGLNPRDFIKVATVNAAGNGRTQNSYEFTDRRLSNLNARTVYYRIKQIDNSGEALYSPVRSVDVDKAKAVSLFPNPVKSVTKLVIDAETAGKATILIRDMSGKTVKQINTQLFKGINQQDLYVAELASGEYNVNVIGQGFNHLLKFTKVN